jgi:hypothetical protein
VARRTSTRRRRTICREYDPPQAIKELPPPQRHQLIVDFIVTVHGRQDPIDEYTSLVRRFRNQSPDMSVRFKTHVCRAEAAPLTATV